MNTMFVRYKVKFDRVSENFDLVKTVFSELNENKATGLSYM